MGKSRVLIVDDAPENIHILIATLQDEYVIMAANNGQKALELLDAGPRPDIILMDILMPGMNGLEVCKKLKSSAAYAAIPVIFLTSQGEEIDEKKGLDCGALDYIVKPFSPDIVKARMRNILDLKKHQDHLEKLVEERTRELVSTQDATMAGMATLVEYRDPETRGHIKRTQSYVRVLCEHLMPHPKFKRLLSEGNVRMIWKSAALHDIGKVGIPDKILLKPGKLTESEFAVIKQHTVYGREAIFSMEMELEGAGLSFLRFAAEIAYTHHEKWDGSGYHGIKGDNIPIPGRIMALADVYDALISRRVYKEPIAHTKAVDVIMNGKDCTSPNHFDPDVLEAFHANVGTFRDIAMEFADFDDERKAIQS